jgi:hypothetical protein
MKLQKGVSMNTWTNEELNRIGAAEELEIAGLRRNGSLRNSVTIWVVRVDQDLYVRSYRGSAGAWHRGALVRHEGRIQAGGVDREVAFVEESDPAINDLVDAAYRTKYRHAEAYVQPMLTAEARATTLKILPR